MATIPSDFIGAHVPLEIGDLRAEAAILKCPLAIVHAFSDVESAGSGFLPTGEPKILFEAHTFHILTGGRWDHSHPNISSAVWSRSLYGAPGVHQYHRLREAMTLDRTAALESCSIGRYQVMGSNFKMAGFVSIDEMWARCCASEGAHLAAFGGYCKTSGMVPLMQLRPPDFVRLALLYNGPSEKANAYDQKLAAAWRHYVNQGEDVIPPTSPVALLARTEMAGHGQ